MTRKHLKLMLKSKQLDDVLRTAQRVKPVDIDGYELFMLAQIKEDYNKVCKKLKRYDR